MTSEVGCSLNVYEAESTATNSSSIPTCNIELQITYRYQLKVPTNEGAVVVIEDVVTPEHCTSLRIPMVFPLSLWRELYLSDILKGLNLDASVRNTLNPKLADAAASLAEKHGNKGFAMVAKVGILKAELMGKDETDKLQMG